MENTIQSYLLGALPEREQQQLEQKYMVDDAQFEELLAAEDDLLDAYVRGELSSTQRKQFETHFLVSPRRQKRLEFARALAISSMSTHPATIGDSVRGSGSWMSWISSLFQPSGLGWRLSLATLALTLAVGTTLFLVREQPLPAVPEQTGRTDPSMLPLLPPSGGDVNAVAPQLDQNKDSKKTGLQADASKKQPRPGTGKGTTPKQPTTLSFVLTPENVRGAGEAGDAGSDENRIVIPAGVDKIQLKIELEPGLDEYKSYSAVIRTVEGTDIVTQNSLKLVKSKSGSVLLLPVAAKLLGTNDYIIYVSGTLPNGEVESIVNPTMTVVLQK